MKRYFLILLILFFSPTWAHPGRTDSSGGHTCHTNCEKYGLQTGEYHYHNSENNSSDITEFPSYPSNLPKITNYSDSDFIKLIKATGKCSSLANEDYTNFVHCAELMKEGVFSQNEIQKKYDSEKSCSFFDSLPLEKKACAEYEKLYSEKNAKVKAFKSASKIGKEKISIDFYDVESVLDGDTISILYQGEVTKVRLIGIDSPESYTTRYGYSECYSEQSNQYLRNLLEGKKISLEFDKNSGTTDPYGRLLAYVFLDGVNINQKMVEEGYAWEYTYNKVKYVYRNAFIKAQKKAKAGGLGLWNKNTCNGSRKDSLESNTGSGGVDNLTPPSKSKTNKKTSTKSYEYIKGPKGGCYYINSHGNKSYVDRSFCN